MPNTLLNHRIVAEQPNLPWLVFLHGAGGSIRTWHNQIEAFKPHYRLILLDLRDHGESQNIQPVLEVYSLQAITNDILRVLDHYQITKASFVTLSMGSFLMQYLMLNRPALIDKCVLAGAVILGNWRIRSFTKFALFFNHILPYRAMYTIFSWLLMPKRSHQQSRSIYLKQAKKISPEAYVRWVGLYDEFFSTLRSFADWKIPAPTLLAMGKSDYVFLGSARTLAAQQPLVELMVIPHSGHICNIDNPEAFNQASLAFLRNA